MQGGVLETNLAVMLPPPLINRERLRTLISGIRLLDITPETGHRYGTIERVL